MTPFDLLLLVVTFGIFAFGVLVGFTGANLLEQRRRRPRTSVWPPGQPLERVEFWRRPRQ